MVSLDVRQLSNSEMLNRVEAAENARERQIRAVDLYSE